MNRLEIPRMIRIWQHLLSDIAGLELATAQILFSLLDSIDHTRIVDFAELSKLTGLSENNTRRLILHLSKVGWVEIEAVDGFAIKLKLTRDGSKIGLDLLSL